MRLQNIVLSLTVCAGLFATEKTIQLPQPDTKGGKPLMEAITLRRTNRAYTGATISRQDLSDILYAAWGVNATDPRVLHTIPTAMNAQDPVIYVALPEGAYKYIPENNTLELVLAEDIRTRLDRRGTDMFAKSAAVVLIASNLDKLKRVQDKGVQIQFAHMHAGCISQDIYLVCAAKGLGTCVVYGINKENATTLLKLPENTIPLYGQPIGVMAK
ncbi:MAG: SagB/ThcOx family dehydrogenase [Victivallales bacterium]|nr:SagB/ThcOx family dehydrogenase [Victivallales bacterium]